MFDLRLRTDEARFEQKDVPGYRLAFETYGKTEGKESKVLLADYSSAAKASPTDYTVFIKAD